MSTHTLTYFPFAGRAEITRMCFYHTGKELKNELITFADLPNKQKEGTLPLSQLPVFQVDNSGYICQSGAIARYAAKINGLYPEDPLQALYVDEIYETVDSLIAASGFCRDSSLSDEEKEKKKQAFIDREITRLENLFKLRVSKDSPFIANKKFSLADIAAYSMLKVYTITSVHVTEEQFKAVAPTAFAYLEKLEKEDAMKNIIAKSKAYHESISK